MQFACTSGDDDLAFQEAFNDFALPLIAASENGFDEWALIESRLGDVLAFAFPWCGGVVVEKAFAIVEEVAGDGGWANAEWRRGGRHHMLSMICGETGASERL